MIYGGKEEKRKKKGGKRLRIGGCFHGRIKVSGTISIRPLLAFQKEGGASLLEEFPLPSKSRDWLVSNCGLIRGETSSPTTQIKSDVFIIFISYNVEMKHVYY